MLLRSLPPADILDWLDERIGEATIRLLARSLPADEALGVIHDRVPPSDPDAEAGVLGALVLSLGRQDCEEYVRLILADLRAEDFHQEPLALLFAAIRQGIERGLGLSAEDGTLWHHLRRQGWWAAVECPAAILAETMQAHWTWAGIPEYVRRLRTLGKIRAIQRVAWGMVVESMDCKDPDEWCQYAQRQIDGLRSGSPG